MADSKRFDNYINGQWVAGADYCTNINPSDLSDVIGEYAKADAAQVNAAIEAARAAFPAWSTSGIQARHDALDKVGSEILARREELGQLLAREGGKTLPEAIGEGTRAGKLEKLAWTDLRQQPTAPPIAYSFKYFQQVEGDVFLPPGFAPVRVAVRLVPRSGAPIEQSFTWADATRDAAPATAAP